MSDDCEELFGMTLSQVFNHQRLDLLDRLEDLYTNPLAADSEDEWR